MTLWIPSDPAPPLLFCSSAQVEVEQKKVFKDKMWKLMRQMTQVEEEIKVEKEAKVEAQKVVEQVKEEIVKVWRPSEPVGSLLIPF